jgi:uncharacterized membrane protein YfcA
MLFFIIGLLAGIVSGMGFGGGTVLIPALIFLAGLSQHTAQGVNLAVFFPAAIVAIGVHAKNGYIKYKMAFYIFIAGALGAFLGAKLAVSFSSTILKKLFGIFLLAMGIYEFIRSGTKTE